MKNFARCAFFALLAILVVIPGCKKTSKFTLRVTLGEGVSGTPNNGNYAYDGGTQINYSYVFAGGYLRVSVTLDGNVVASSGNFLMNSDHTLEVEAIRDVSGYYSGTTSQGYPVTVTVVTEGDQNKATLVTFKIQASSGFGSSVFTINWNMSEFLNDSYIADASYDSQDMDFSFLANFSGASGHSLNGHVAYFKCWLWGGQYTVDWVDFHN
jgi:hypothetical protein